MTCSMTSRTAPFPPFLCEMYLEIVLIAAAGYIINDILDQETDYDNRPESTIVGKTNNPYCQSASDKNMFWNFKNP